MHEVIINNSMYRLDVGVIGHIQVLCPVSLVITTGIEFEFYLIDTLAQNLII